MYVLYIILLTLLSLYSYVLIDPNITLFQSSIWEAFRNHAVQIGYHNRELSWSFYFMLIILLFIFHLLFISKSKQFSAFRISLIVGTITLCAYPFLSHDLFNYMFDAKILTFYGENPYTHMALDFPEDPWLRFMHWTHRTYPYGPSFLALSIIPAFLSFGKFIIHFFLLKLIFVVLYVISVKLLQKINAHAAVIFATHPLIIVEGLVNTHNDFIAVAFGIIGIYYVFNSRNLFGKFMFLLSGGIKYITLPSLMLEKKNKHALNIITFLGVMFLIGFVIYRGEVQQWYFLNILFFIPYFEKFISQLKIFFAGVLFSYYPYIRLGGWDTPEKVDLKYQILLLFAALNILWLLYYYFFPKKSKIPFFNK